MKIRLTKPRTDPDGNFLDVDTILSHPLYGRAKYKSARVEERYRKKDKYRMLFWMRDGTAEPADDEAEEAFAEHRKLQEAARERQDKEDAAQQAWKRSQQEKAMAERQARFERRLLAGTLPPQRSTEPEVVATPEAPEPTFTVTPDEAATLLADIEPGEEETDEQAANEE